MYNAGMKIATYDKIKASLFICEAFLVDERVFVLNPLVVATYQAFATIESIESLVFRAAIFLVQGKFCDAMLTLTALLKQLPDRKSRIFQLRAACYLALGNYLYCLRDLNKSHIHNTHNNQIDFLKAQVFLAMGQWDSAYQSSLKFTTTAHPDDPNLHAQYYNLATLALKLGMGEAVGIVFYNSAKKTEQRYMELNKGRTMTPIPDMKKAALAYFENNLIYSNYKLFFKIQEAKLETTLTGMCCQCGQSSAKLSACSACTIVQYCSKGCQYNHWHKHKQDCTKLRQINVK
jgi:tetratricopeptide (TPR) repeat protein